MAFQSMNLAKNHCIRIAQNSTKIKELQGNELSDDIILKGDVLIDFDSSGCNRTLVGSPLKSDSGFLMNITATGIYFLRFYK